ncbi:TPA: hypothetical protein VGT17_005205 [Vibrio harveyi]|nr:hypothetical protein [Vibrio harveyi]HEQ3599237.1 hypothetical protein [Vibrio harveyi]HEQ3611295.1 hypothetical protein [Vibrio harveyi]
MLDVNVASNYFPIVTAIVSGVTTAIVIIVTLRSDFRWLKETTEKHRIEINKRLNSVESRVLEVERLQRK